MSADPHVAGLRQRCRLRSLGGLIRRGSGGFRLRSLGQRLGDAAVVTATTRSDSGDELLGRTMGFVVRDLAWR